MTNSNELVGFESFTALCQLLLKRSDETIVQIETVRTLLERHGVFPRPEYEALLSEIRAQHQANMREVVETALGRALESLRGPKE